VRPSPPAKTSAVKKVAKARAAPRPTVAKKVAPVKTAARKAPVAKAVAVKRLAAKKPPVKTAPVKKGVPAKVAAAKKAPTKNVPATGGAKGRAQAGKRNIKAAKLPAERAPRRAPAKESSSRPAPSRPVAPRAPRRGYTEERFLTHQRNFLERERATYLEQANSLQAEADQLVAEMEPGDIQFDEESGEGGTVAVDRERDLTLSAQALEAVEEIEAALAKIGSGRYGVCEGCGELIPKPRLEALPFARLCMACKSGGLSRR